MSDIKELVDVLDFAKGLVSDLDARVKDDGSLSIVEIITLVAGNSAAGFAAVKGLGDISAELKDLDRAEIEQIASKSVELAKAVIALVGDLK